MPKSLDAKLERIASDPSCPDFILADAKDADMAYGVAAPGTTRGSSTERTRYRSIQDYRDQIREIVRQQLVDIMLMSVNTSDELAVRERLFDESPVTPAIRANDTTDIWLAPPASPPRAGEGAGEGVGGQAAYVAQPSLPFRTPQIDEAMGMDNTQPVSLRCPTVSLGLYSITLNNDAAQDRATLAAYREFRAEARQFAFRHFLEVFPPNAPREKPVDVPRFVNDSIARLLAGVGSATRPLFLKMPYFGPAALEQLVAYDGSLVVGILGGSAGTTFDAFHMLWEAKKHGARAALFGRKINNAEHQLSFVAQLRALADGHLEPAEAVRAYHAELEKLGIKPDRPLKVDLEPSAQ